MLLAALAVGTSACNGGSDVPAGAVAVVDGTQVPKSALDELINRQKAVYASQNQEFPTEGSESYNDIQRNYVVYLVQQAEFQQEAKKLGVVVSQQDVDDALEAFIDSNYSGDRTKFQRSLKAQGFTLATFKESLRASVLTRKVLAAANRNVTVDDRDVVAYYKLNRATKYPDTPFKQVKDSIHATLLDQKRGEANVAWIQNLSIRYEDKVDYAKGFEPPGS
jgi:peptidyl-prolyl cis-trans isomerase SurA